VTCPSEDSLLLDQLGELSVNDSRALRAHVDACPPCQKRRDQTATLLGDVAAVARAHGPGDDLFADRVGRAIRTPQVAAPTRRRYAPLLAVAATLVLVPALWGWRARPDSTFTARGTRPARISQADVLLARAGQLLSLDGQTLRPSDALAVRVTNTSAHPLHLLAFIRDRNGEVHWLYPAYRDSDSNPSAAEIPSNTRARLLDELVTPEGPAAGPLRIVSVLSPTPLTVKEAEARLARGDEAAALFPGAVVRQWTAIWEDTK
jgi:hypothetical protein